MQKDKDIKLVKCSNCSKAFYIRTKTKGKFKLRCPYCEKDVEIIINGDSSNGASYTPKP